MTTPRPANGWPSEPGVPLRAETDGWHWLGYRGPDRTIFCKLWSQGLWIEASGHPKAGASLVCLTYRYIGPCLTPAEIAAMVQAHDARVTELLHANNREVERRRAAENAMAEAVADALDDTYTDEDGVTWSRPTAFAYAAACRALRARPSLSDRMTMEALDAARNMLSEACLQIEYLHSKFRATGSGEAVLAKIRALLATPKDGEKS